MLRVGEFIDTARYERNDKSLSFVAKTVSEENIIRKFKEIHNRLTCEAGLKGVPWSKLKTLACLIQG